jgi:hypothetical protein
MAHIEVLVEVDHLRTDGMEEPHVLQVKVDGLAANEAWGRVDTAVSQFLQAELEMQAQVNREVQAAEGPWCNHNGDIDGVGYVCNLPPHHQGWHENFSTGNRWIDPSAAQIEYDRMKREEQDRNGAD